jgi:hypothetical protein
MPVKQKRYMQSNKGDEMPGKEMDGYRKSSSRRATKEIMGIINRS